VLAYLMFYKEGSGPYLNEPVRGRLEALEGRAREILVAAKALQQQVHAVQVHLDLVLRRSQ
jgi:hypothetical protein